MQSDTLYWFEDRSSDAGFNLQYFGPEETCQAVHDRLRWVGQLGKPRRFHALNLFEQVNEPRGDCRLLRIKAWSIDKELFIDFCQYVADELNLKLVEGLPEK